MDLTHNKCVAAQKQTYNMREGGTNYQNYLARDLFGFPKRAR